MNAIHYSNSTSKILPVDVYVHLLLNYIPYVTVY